LTDADLAYEVTQFERDTAVSLICSAAAKLHAARIEVLMTLITPARGSRCIELTPGSIADVIALEHAAAEEAHITGLELEHCQKYVRRNAGMVAGLKKNGAA
jgi:hypothetical protein